MFTIKDGFKLGLGFTFGAAIFKAVDEVLGRRFSSTANGWLNTLNEKEAKRKGKKS